MEIRDNLGFLNAEELDKYANARIDKFQRISGHELEDPHIEVSPNGAVALVATIGKHEILPTYAGRC